LPAQPIIAPGLNTDFDTVVVESPLPRHSRREAAEAAQ
jgi:hypothetical protein